LGQIPAFVAISSGKVHDVNALDWIVFEPGAFYVMDRAYVDGARLARVDGTGAFFVTSVMSHVKSRIKTLQFDAGFCVGKLHRHPIAGAIAAQVVAMQQG